MYTLFKRGKRIINKSLEDYSDVLWNIAQPMNAVIIDRDGFLVLKEGYTIEEVKE